MSEISSPKIVTKGGLSHFVNRSLYGIKREYWGPADPWLEDARDRHAGETCFVLGNGPSLSQVPNDVLSRYSSFGSNGIFLKYQPTYFVTVSQEFYRNHQDTIGDLNVQRKFIAGFLKGILSNDSGSYLNCCWNLYGCLGSYNFPVPFRFSKRADRVVYLGGSVLFVCLQLAYWLGFTRVILLGVDHNFGFDRSKVTYGGKRIEVDGEEDNIHFDPKYNPKGHSMHCDMIATERSFQLALDAFQKDGREMLNATEGTGLDVIPKVSLHSILEEDGYS